MDEENPAPLYKRILLKISGESLQGSADFGLSKPIIDRITHEIHAIHQLKVDIAIVIGGGNFFRGVNAGELLISRSAADHMGMLATVMNGIALNESFQSIGLPSRHMSALQVDEVAERFNKNRAIRHLEQGRIVIFSAGTGNPCFTTDTAAALRAIEIKADVFLKATMVDGVYSADPKTHHNTQKFTKISYEDVIFKNLKVIDHTAITLCRENNIPIKVFNINKKGNIIASLTREDIGSTIN